MEIKKYIHLTILGLLLLAFNACKKDTADANIAYRPVVIGYIVAGKPVELNIYEQKGILDTSSYGPGITGLSVHLSNGVKTVTLADKGAGRYTYDDPAFITPLAKCTMNFSYNGTTVSSETAIPATPLNFKSSATEQGVPEPDPFSSSSVPAFTAVTFTWAADVNSNFLLAFRNRDPARLMIGTGFGSRPTYQDREEYLGKTNYYVTSPMTFGFTGDYKIFLYNVNPEYNTILNNSSNSSLNLTNKETNIKNGFGIFTGMSCDSLVIKVFKQT